MILEWAIWKRLSKFSQATFGTDVQRGPIGALEHLKKEADEAKVKKDGKFDLEEFADCFILILDATRRAGFNYGQLLRMSWSKLKKCEQRKWPPFVPGVTDPNVPLEHVRIAPLTPLQEELAYFEAHRKTWCTMRKVNAETMVELKWAVVGKYLNGGYMSHHFAKNYSEALTLGIKCYGVSKPFLIKSVTPHDEVFSLPG